MNNDFIDVRKRNRSISKRLIDELRKHQQKCTKDNIPFCYRCAKLDYEDKTKEIIREALRREGDVKESDLKLPKIDLKRYVGKNIFEEKETKEAWEKVKGTGEEKHIGYHVDFKCTKRGCGVSVFTPKEKYETLNK